jgi:hypothetical protein
MLSAFNLQVQRQNEAVKTEEVERIRQDNAAFVERMKHNVARSAESGGRWQGDDKGSKGLVLGDDQFQL